MIDASVAVQWFLQEPGSIAARAVLTREGRLVAPDRLLLEVANVLRRKERRGEITPAHVDRATGRLASFFHEILPTEPLLASAVALSRQLDHPVSDCVFLAAAMVPAACLITADEHFHRKLGAWGNTVELLEHDARAHPA
ncbi:MAG: type II toxin-antitoxin system VapC family toxin [Pseudomonadota bacterium]|nr:type II toxin-antitoxin system VapC family toxin [Pseudomonadota bacterium]